MAEKKVPINFIFKGIDELSGPLRAVNKRIAETTGPLKRFQGQIQSFGKLSGINQLGTAISGVTKEVAGLGLGLVAAATGAYFAIDRLVGTTIKQNAALADTAKKTGLSVEQLQLWHYAAEQSGSSAEALDKSLVIFSKTLSDTRRGQGALVELMGNDSQFITQLRGIKSTEKAYEFFLKTLGNVPDSANQIKIATAGMGKSGAESIQLAEEAAKGNLKTLFETRAAMGLIGSDTAEAFDNVDDTFSKISTQLSVLKTGIVAELLPTIQQLANDFSKWINDNKPEIIALTKAFAKELPSALNKTYSVVMGIVNLFGGFGNVLKIIGVIIGGQILVSLAGLVSSLAALGSALFTIGSVVAVFIAPFLTLPVIIGAAVAALYLLYKYCKPVRDIFDQIFVAIGNVLSRLGPVGEKIKSVFSAIGGFIGVGDQIGKNTITSSAPQLAPAIATAPLSPQNQSSEATIKVRFENQPEGMRVQTQNPDKVAMDVYSGFNNW